jgi:hypothetical protein
VTRLRRSVTALLLVAPLNLAAAGSVASRGFAASSSGLCGREAGFVDARFGGGWTVGVDNGTTCDLSKNEGGFSMVLNFTGSLPGPLTAEQEWKAGHTPGDHERAWLVKGLGRLAPHGVSVLGGVPGHGTVTAVFTYTGAPGGSYGDGLEVDDGYNVIGAGVSEWPDPIGRVTPTLFPLQHQHAVHELAARLVPLFYSGTKP